MLYLRRFLLLLCLTAAPVLAQRGATAQEDAAPPANGARETPRDAEDSPGIRQVGPKVFVVPDEKGRLRKVLGLSHEELQDLLKLREQLRDPETPRRYHFDDVITVNGTADDRHAELEVDCKVATHDTNWVRVPLALNDSILQKWTFDGWIEYEREGDGHVAWIRSKGRPSTQRIQLRLLTPVSRVGEENRIALKLPQIVASDISLRVATPNAVAVAGERTEITETKGDDKGTRFQLRHPSGELRLAWHATDKPAQPRETKFEADAKILLDIESQTRIKWDATFSVTVTEGTLTILRVRLPDGATIPAQTPPGVRDIRLEEDSGSKNAGPIAIVELESPIAKGKSQDVRLLCERSLGGSGNPPKSTSVDVAGFEVLGSVGNHRGHIGIISDDAWRAEAVPGKSMYRENSLPEGFREAGVRGSDVYFYDTPDHSLAVTITPRRKKINVTPTYAMYVAPNEVRLDARLQYRVLGVGGIDTCAVELAGWNVQGVEVFDEQGGQTIEFDPFESELLELDLPRSMRGEFEIRIAAAQELPVDAIDFAVELVKPVADDREGALLAVLPDDNVQLHVLDDATRGLRPANVEPPMALPARQQKALVFQEETEAAPAILAVEIDVRTREVLVDSHADVSITNESVDVRQRFDYDVRFEPLQSVHIDTPRELRDDRSMTARLDGEPVPPQRIDFVDAVDASDGESVLQLALPETHPGIGQFSVEFSYSVPLSPLEPGAATTLSLSLLQPVGEELTWGGQTVDVISAANIRTEATDPTWQADGSPPGGEALRLRASEPTARLDLATTYSMSRQTHTTVVEKLWLQTWLTHSARQDRAVYQVRTNDHQLALTLPSDLPVNELVVVVDGADVPVELDDDGRLALSLSRDDVTTTTEASYGRHTIELWWPQVEGRQWGRLRLTPPEVEDAWVRRVYWHVVMPRGELALFPPGEMASEMVWASWWQKPRLTQGQLEDWSGATAQISPESGEAYTGSGQFLFSGVGRQETLSLATYSLVPLLLVFSAGILGAGFLFVYVRAARHPITLFVAALILICLGFLWPAAAVLAAQAAAVTLAVVLAARLMEHLLLRRRLSLRPFGIDMARSESRRHRGDTSVEPVLGGRPSTTATASAAMQMAVPSPEAKP